MTPDQKKLKPPQYIDKQEEFERLIQELKGEKTLAVDTEANSLFAYKEQVCLLQISSHKGDFIIDPLTVDELTPIGAIFADTKIEKIFHASEYDLLILNDEFGFKFRNIFDTMLAAQILGKKNLGLDAILVDMFGIKVNKKYQRANWGKRPLSPDMLQYAQIDTHYLIGVRENLARELNEQGLDPIAAEDFARACHVHRHEKEEKYAAMWKINGAKKLSPQKAAVLLSLWKYRDQFAKKINQPVFKVLNSQSLVPLAEHSPTDTDQLLQLELVGKKAINRHAEGLIKAIKRGLESTPVYPPQKESPDEAFLAREKALRDWRKSTARKMKVNSAVVLPRDLLYSLVLVNPTSKKELAQVLVDVPWRFKRFGDQILSVLRDI
jgi:ribonuclease D